MFARADGAAAGVHIPEPARPRSDCRPPGGDGNYTMSRHVRLQPRLHRAARAVDATVLGRAAPWHRPDILSLRALRFLTNGAGAKHAWLEFRDACSWGKLVTFTTSLATHSWDLSSPCQQTHLLSISLWHSIGLTSKNSIAGRMVALAAAAVAQQYGQHSV